VTRELPPDRQSVAEAALQRVLDYVQGEAVSAAVQTPGETVDEGTESSA
jgi:hypothetical protein